MFCLSEFLSSISVCNNQIVSCWTCALVEDGGIRCHQNILSTPFGLNE